jgi:ABC-type lipoprotein release transport system permease subunit
MLISIAWKNIWRKPSRSLVLITAIVIGLSGAVFSIALTEGMLQQRNQNSINRNYSHIQIHNPDFQDNMKLSDTIHNVVNVIENINKDPDVEAFTSRLKFFGMANTSRSMQGVVIFGIDPDKEKQVTTIYKCLQDTLSQYLPGNYDNEILISKRLAQNLKLVYYQYTDEVDTLLLKRNISTDVIDKLSVIKNQKIRNKNAFKDSLRAYLSADDFDKFADVIIDLSTHYSLRKKIILRFTDAYGNIIDDAFKVCGIYKTNDAMFDNMNVFVHKDYLANLTNVNKNTSTEIALLLKNEKEIASYKNKLAEKYPNLLIQSFFDLDPFMMIKKDFLHIYYFFILGFILFALSFGIINTILMSVMERTKELGMLMAVGMKKIRVFTMIMLESIFLSLSGGVLGMIIGGAISLYVASKGLDMSAYAGAWEAYGVSSVIHPVLKFNFFFATAFMVILTGILASLYPARKALKLNPSDALRSDT